MMPTGLDARSKMENCLKSTTTVCMALVTRNCFGEPSKRPIMRSQRKFSQRLWVEELESRLVPSSVTSTNWSGYAVETNFSTPQTAAVSAVRGSWTVPDVATTTSGYSLFWVGIDGYRSRSVEQIGTGSDYVNGVKQFFAWY